MKSTNELGEKFERQVEIAYQSLGYETKRNIELCGQQIDILATKFLPGTGQIKIIIECKYRSKGSVSNQEVYQFSSVIGHIRQSINIIKGVMVTNLAFSKPSKTAAEESIKLITLDELLKEVFDIKEGLRSFISEYESENIFFEYIPLSARLKKEVIDNVEEFIFTNTINNPHENAPVFYSVLGSYGSGKTTLLKRLYYRFAKVFMDDPTIKPFYLELKEYHKFKNLHSYLVASYYKNFSRDISFDILKKAIDNRGFLFLLDGFDEMSPQINKEVRASDFKVIAEIVLSNSPCILTCRPGYFVSEEEYDAIITRTKDQNYKKLLSENSLVLSVRQRNRDINQTYNSLQRKLIKSNVNSFIQKHTQTIELSALNETQIILYLQKFSNQFFKKCGASANEILQFIKSIFRLKDLLNKPLLLFITKEIILHKGKDFKKYRSEYGPAILYQMYAEMKLELDWGKGDTRQFLTIKERGAFATALALAMFETSTLDADYGLIISVINDKHILTDSIQRRLGTLDKEAIASDIQICTFITRTDDSRFKFIHASYMEFFVAKYLVDAMRNNVLDSKFSNSLLKGEILHFVGSFSMNEPKLLIKLKSELKNSNEPILKRNLSIAMMFSAFNHKELHLASLELIEATLSGMSFEESHWQDVLFEKIDLDEVRFERAKFSNLKWKDCKWNVVYLNYSLVEVTLIQSTIIKLSLDPLERDSLCKLNCIDVELTESHIQNVSINFTISGIQIKDSSFMDCHLIFSQSENQYNHKIVFERTEISKSSIEGVLSYCSGDLKFSKVSCVSLECIGIPGNKFLIIGNSMQMENCLMHTINIRIEKGSNKFSECTFENIVFEIEKGAKTEFNNCKFSNCVFKKNRDFEVSFTRCAFFSVTMEVIMLLSFEQNSFDSTSKGLLIQKSTKTGGKEVAITELDNIGKKIQPRLFLVAHNHLLKNHEGFDKWLSAIGVKADTYNIPNS